MRKLHIAVIGSDGDHCSKYAGEVAYETGKLIARRDCILITGGRTGVMEESSRGAAENGGLVVGVLPSDRKEDGNRFLHVAIPTGIGFARGYSVINAADGVIAIEGGLGTLAELCHAYWRKIPTAAIKGTGGTADKYADQQLDERFHPPIKAVRNPEEALDYILMKIQEQRIQGEPQRL